MHSLADWSVGIGRWRGVPVRIHLLFVVLAVVTFFLASQDDRDPDLLWASATGLGVLLASVVVHELGHIVAAKQLGGTVDEVVLGPLGGLVPVRIPSQLRHEWIAAVAGPAANLLLAAIIGIPLAAARRADLLGLLNPITPAELVASTPLLTTLRLAVWVNWLLFLVNLLPAFPFDGGPALRALLKPAVGSRSAVIYTARIAALLACLLLVSAWIVRNQYEYAAVSAWPALALLGIFLLFSARRDAARLGQETRHEPSDNLLLGDYLEASAFEEIQDEQAVLVQQSPRRHEREDGGHPLESFEEARLDDVLARLHESSLEELSPEDRRLLLEASIRYRRRRRQRDAADSTE